MLPPPDAGEIQLTEAITVAIEDRIINGKGINLILVPLLRLGAMI